LGEYSVFNIYSLAQPLSRKIAERVETDKPTSEDALERAQI
jgi:hypothetical protein